jgi:hypothetical protein
LSGTAAAGGIALINSIGNLGGYAGPFVVGWISDACVKISKTSFHTAFRIVYHAFTLYFCLPTRRYHENKNGIHVVAGLL